MKIFTELSIAFVLITLITTGATWQLRRVRADSPPDPNRFGMIGLTRGQTLRLNIVNLTPPDPNTQIPPPCRVVLSFRDANGRPFTNSAGQVIRREVLVQAGDSDFLDLNADLVLPPTINADVAPVPPRVQLRPFVRVLSPPDPNRTSPPDPCFPTAEVFDNTTGRTSIFAVGFAQTPPDPNRQ